MKRLAFCLLPVALSAGQARYARLGDFDGAVQVQLQAAEDWQAARRNMPLPESAWVRTEAGGRVEVELDDGNVFRLGPDSLAELSDYTRLSTGQRITLIGLDHGVGYFTGAAADKDVMVVAVPGAQVTIHQAARLRVEARDPWSLLAAVEGVARLSFPNTEFDLAAGQMVKLDPQQPAHFALSREIPPLETDRWSEERDRVLVSTASGEHLPGLKYGQADLDTNGTWAQSADFGFVWKPKAPTGWAPFRNGKWLWYESLGYTWISDDAWGWLPYHYGRWMNQEGAGWVWAPGENTVFKPGDVYWLKSAKLVGWGALAPGENWKPPDTPHLFLNANTTYANYAPETREIDPAGFTARPREPLATAVFVEALPSPPFPAARLDAFRPPLRVGNAGAVAVSTDAAFGDPAPPPDPAPAPAPVPAPDAGYTNAQPEAPPVVVVQAPPEQVPVEVDVPVPVYTGIIVVYPRGYKATAPAPAPKKPSKPVSLPPVPKPKAPETDKPGK